MTPAILSAVLLLQADPRIEEVERLAGPAHRPLLWCPLEVTLTSAAGFKGDLAARSSFGFLVARSVEVAAGGRRRVILPAIDPVEVTAGPASARAPAERARAEILVGVDSGLAFAGDLASTDKVLYRKIGSGDLKELLDFGLLEAFDLLLLADPAGLPLAAYGTTGKWAAPRTREEAEAAVAGLGRPPPRFGAVDVEPHRLLELAPRDGWVPAKKTHAIFFATLYAFAAFVALVAAARRGPRAAAAAAAGTAVLFVGIYFLAFPRGRLWLVEHSCEVVPPEGDAAEWRIWFAGAGTPVETGIVFPRLVKPVFPRSSGADEPFTIRIEGRGGRVAGLNAPAGRAPCVAAGGDRAPTMRAGAAFPAPLWGAVVVREGRRRPLGDLAAGSPVPAEAAEGGPDPMEPDFAALAARFASADCAYGRLDPGERPARDVASPDLADARVRPRLWIQRLK